MRRALARALVVALVVGLVSATAGAQPASAAPVNDNFANALSVSTPGMASGNSTGATVEAGEQFPCQPLTGSTVWYKFVAPANARVMITTLTTDPNLESAGYYDTVLALYSGTSLADLQWLQCNDDIAGGYSLRSGINTTAAIVGGQTYFLQVGGYQNRQGNFQLHLTYSRLSDSRDCDGGYTNWGSVACKWIGGFGQEPKQDGFQATWPSVGLNLTNDGARSGSFISQALWFIDTGDMFTARNEWLEIGDTVGTGQMQGHQDFWERWFYWVDGSNFPTTYIEHGIGLSPNDGANRTYIIQWEPSENQWGIYLCPGSCIREGSAPWRAPGAMLNQFEEVGLEVSTHVHNSNSNSALIQDTGIQSRTFGGGWAGWSGSNTHWEITTGCSFGYPSTYCLNGIWNSGPPPYDNWRNNKP